MADIVCNPKKCEAECYGNCSGKISGRKFIYYCQPRAKYNMIEYDQDVIVNVCDMHYHRIMLKTNGKTPEMYGWDLADALDILSCCDFSKMV